MRCDRRASRAEGVWGLGQCVRRAPRRPRRFTAGRPSEVLTDCGCAPLTGTRVADVSGEDLQKVKSRGRWKDRRRVQKRSERGGGAALSSPLGGEGRFLEHHDWLMFSGMQLSIEIIVKSRNDQLITISSDTTIIGTRKHEKDRVGVQKPQRKSLPERSRRKRARKDFKKTVQIFKRTENAFSPPFFLFCFFRSTR